MDDPCPIPTREGTTVDKVSIHRFILTWSRKPVGRFETSRTGDSGITARSSFLLDGNLRAARVLTIIGPRRIVDPLEKNGIVADFLRFRSVARHSQRPARPIIRVPRLR